MSDTSSADEDEVVAQAEDVPAVDSDLAGLTREELRRRTEAPLPRSLLEFLR